MTQRSSHVRSRRVPLSVPATSERALAKATTLAVDEVVIDLEDAVPTDQKVGARQRALAALAAGGWRTPLVSVRVNAPGTPWCHEDLIACATAPVRPASVIVPKVEAAGDLAFVSRLLDGVERGVAAPAPLTLQALIETAAGLRRLDEIAVSSPRLEALILGYADLAASLGRSRAGAEDLDRWLPIQETFLIAARAHGLQAIDGPYLRINEIEPLARAATRVRDLGFDGKWAIHPGQVATLAETFTPTREEIERARAILAALEAAERASGLGAVAFEGEMLDEAVRRSALRVLVRAEAAGGDK
jgi:citrate lyase subunit beta/citryl-CoA lyase